MPKLEEIFALVAILCYRYKMLAVWKILIARLFCFELQALSIESRENRL